ncbi:DUF433 domain-containing protein [Thermus brockianus]|uniref:Putative antitoxin VapB45-like DNA-binding HTH domain-containing protein n=1 Tax=Thermus brockianus TaxID=56956 RepID=A0ABM7XMT7_THEBO|nr:DUF433 domain-containing protein [Thermus brockianus]BDG17699.1 hypothetical protein TbrSNM41_24330 [Thermus brockianus]
MEAHRTAQDTASQEHLDPRDRPLYTIPEAARYLGLSEATLRTWVRGRSYPRQGHQGYSPPLVETPGNGPYLSFFNLVEANVLAALRQKHHVPMRRIRQMVEYAKEALGEPRPLLLDLEAGLGDVFLRQGEKLLALTRTGQLALREVLESYLSRVERDERGLPLRFHPAVGTRLRSERVVLDPKVAFGAPTVRGVKTAVIALRFNAGESLEDIATDYGVGMEEVREALVFEGLGMDLRAA